MIHALRNDSTGSYLVSTESGAHYLFDLDSRSLCRVAARSSADLERMRRDGDDIHLVELVECIVGSRMVLLVDLGIPAVTMTRRRSSNVRKITQLWPLDEMAQLDRPVAES